MKTNLILLTLAMVFGILGVAGGETYFGPPYICYFYMCGDSNTTCQAANGICGTPPIQNPYNAQSVVSKWLGSCLESDGQGCTSSPLAICGYFYDYMLKTGETCDQANLQCTGPIYEPGCNS